jgi:AAA15 family ATPase/GTPase
MASLLGIRIKNYRALADFRLGQVQYGRGEPLPRLACLIGPNGSGKSTVLDAFGFLADCLLEGVEAACDKPHRGGFDRLHTQDSSGPIELEMFFDAGDAARPIVYELFVDLVKNVPSVVKETLRQRQRGETRG